MRCPNCQRQNPEEALFCLRCGTGLAALCPACGAELPPDPDVHFCFKCGTKVPPPGTARADSPDSVAEHLGRLVPKEYADRLLATRGQVGRERRIVTILFSDVKGSTAMAEDLDPEEWLEIMDGAFGLLIEPVFRYEGTLARLMGDAILAFFGAPIAHEDDPERAIRAALEIVAGSSDYAARLEEERGISGFAVRVGINTGLVVVGEVGSDLRVEYTAMGDAVNLAARMEQAAPPGSILISHDTYRHVRGVFDVRQLEPLTVKGRAEAVQTYLVQQAKTRAFYKPSRGVEGIETRMVGREAELKHLQDAFYTALEDRELQMTTASGEAGVGKSRLLHEFDVWSELLPQQFFYFRGRASQEMQNLPYGLLRDLIAFRFQIQDSDTAAVVREKLEEGVRVALGAGEGSQGAAHLIGHLLGFELGAGRHLAGLLDDAQQFRDRALVHLADYFRGMAAQSPVLILLEDLHWADDSSLDVLNHLALTLAGEPVMVVCAARPALFERRPRWGEGQRFHTRLALEPLSRWDSRRLVAEILQKVEEVPEALRDLVVASAEGNPFFIEELIKMLVEDGVIATGQDRWRLDSSRLTEVRVPPTLTGVLQARLDHLPPEERTVLQQASVVGRLFWDRAVACINDAAGEGIEQTEIPENLAALRGREMIFQRETSAFAGAQEYVFRHNMLREITYESVLKRVRRVYHGLVADWLLEQAGERAEEYTGLIAEHLALAGRAVEAVDCLQQAGDRARALYAHREAIRAYERALALLQELGDEGQAARTLMKLGLAYHTAFDFRQAHRAYEEGFALWQKAGKAQPTVPPPPAPHALRIGYGVLLGLDPTTNTDSDTADVIAQLFSGLVALTPDLDVVPDVARSWEVSAEGRRYLFHLRDDVRWSDGLPVTAADFEYAAKRMLDPAIGSPAAALLYDVQGAMAFHQGQATNPDQVAIKAQDETTLLVELEEPTAYFLQLLHLLVPVPRHTVQTWGRAWIEPDKIVTNGPFRLEQCQPGERLVLARNPTYHGRFSGNLQRVELCVLPHEAWPAKLQMYEAGNLDVLLTHWIPGAEMDRIRQRYSGEQVSPPTASLVFVAFDASRPPFDDPRVRQAFALATDRETLAGVAYGGYHFPATGGVIPPGMPGHSPGIGLPYDPDRARRLLAEAGYPGGRGFPAVDLPLCPGTTLRGEYLLPQWQENLGVPITSDRSLDWPAYLDMLNRDLPHLWLIGWGADYADPDTFLRSGPRWYRSGWKDEIFFGLLDEAKRLTDQHERMQLYRQADRIAIEQAAIIPLTYLRAHFLVKPWVKRLPTSPIQSWFWQDVIIEAH